MTIRRRTMFSVALALVVALTALTQMAGASHPRPKAASPLRVSLVPAYQQCTASNRTHGPPLAFPSCNPPAQASSFVTVGTPDGSTVAANSVGYVMLKVSLTAAENLTVTGSVTDVRCKPGTSASVCSSANAAAGPDYAGELEVDMTVRVTDHFNAVSPGGGTDPATMIDIPSPVRMTCASTAATATGGVCNVVTGPCPPGGCSTVRDGDRTVAGISQIRLLDGGSDGLMNTTPNTVFGVQGIFIP